MTTTMQHPEIDFYSSATASTATATTTLSDLIDAIRSDEFAAKIARLRSTLAAGDDDGYAVAKKDLQAVSISGTADGKRAKAIEEGRFSHSGLLQLDFDAADNVGWTVEEIVEILQAEPRIVAAFVSPSGHGVKGIARIPVCKTKDEHVAAFAAARNHFRAHNLTIDEACKDPVRLMFVSHDPGAWLDLERTAVFEPDKNTDKNTDKKTVKKPGIDRTAGFNTDKNTDKKPGIKLKAPRTAFPEPPREGIHAWLMQAAWHCRFANMSEADTAAKLDGYEGQLRRSYQPNEVRDAVQTVYAKPLQDPDWKAANIEVEKESPVELLARAYALQFDEQDPPPPDETCMAIGDIPIAARGNLTVLQGKSKVGKSAVISAILGAAQRGNRTLSGDTLEIAWSGEATGAILHIDTEQSRADWHALVCRGVLRSGAGQASTRLVSLPLIPFTRAQRLKILKLAMEKERDLKGKIDAVVLDGIADLCSSPNDEAEALELVGTCMALAQEFHCPLFCVLHENPGSDIGKTRGHLGSELNRKAFANIRIEKDAETSISTIYGSEMRKRDIPREQGFCFGWSEEEEMHVFLARAGEIKTSVKEAKARIEAEGIFPLQTSVRYSEAVNAIMDALGCTKRTAERRMITYEGEGIIFKTTAGNYMRNE
jgi:hypothetical protein